MEVNSFRLLFSAIFCISFCNAQLVQRESRLLLQVPQILEYPETIKNWNRWTDFCSIPQSPFLTVICSGNHITELTIVGNKSAPSGSNFKVSGNTLSERFSIDSFFTVLTKLSGLEKLTLVNLGLWGSLPGKINRFRSLESLNLSSNSIYGEIPKSVNSYMRLRNLDLSNNLLNGSVPDLSGLLLLENLDLGENYLGPRVPNLGGNLMHISMKNNAFRSEIPLAFKDLNRLRFLDVSSNHFVGPIPPFLFSLSSIQYISVARNQLTGALPASVSCNRNLSFVDLSNNLLIGKLPSCLGSNGGNVRVIVMMNCLTNTSSKYQRPYAFCQKDAIAVLPPERTRGGLGSGSSESATLKLGIVIGVIVGVVVILSVIGFLIVVAYRRLRRRNEGEYKCDSFVIEKNPVRGGGNRAQPMRMASFGLPPYNVFTPDEIDEATNSFDPSSLVVEGSQGQIYKGRLRDGCVVLVKRMKVKQKHSIQALHQHMEVVSKLRHPHLVSVLGHCIVSNQDHPNAASTVFIVLQNISNGSLRDHLTDWRKRDVLKWPQRMSMTMGIARGIQYLHTGGIHGNNLKIENILLDDSLTPKICSYNISLPSKIGAESPFLEQDTSNHTTSENPEKDDIYKLGIVLIEVITGRPINSQSELEDLKFQLERCIAESPSKLRDFVDPSMRGTFAYESLKTAVQITIDCLCKDPMGRPTAEDVIWHMQYSVQVQEGSSGNLSGSLSGSLSMKM